MIDNIKLFVTNKEEFEQNVCKSQKIDFKGEYDIETGEAKDYPKKGKYFNMDVRITESSAYVFGSLHKFFNGYLSDGKESHNYNTFDYKELNYVIDELTNSLGILPTKTTITNLEFGFNVLVSNDPKYIVDKNIIFFNHQSHNRDLKFAGRGDFKEFQKTDYNLKIYNKSKQYSQQEYILRVEVKIKMKRVIQRLGIYSLNDLKDKEKLNNLFEFFLDKINRLHIIDDFQNREDIPESVKAKLLKFTNSLYWKRIFEKPKPFRKNYINEFEKLIRKYRLDSLKKEIINKIEFLYANLLNP